MLVDVDKIIDKNISNLLEDAYGEVYRSAREIILNEFKFIEFNGEWRLHAAIKKLPYGINQAKILYQIVTVKDENKGFYDPNTNVISISDWAFMQPSRDDLCKIIIHELLHAQRYEHNNVMYNKVEQMLKELKEKNPLIF